MREASVYLACELWPCALAPVFSPIFNFEFEIRRICSVRCSLGVRCRSWDRFRTNLPVPASPLAAVLAGKPMGALRRGGVLTRPGALTAQSAEAVLAPGREGAKKSNRKGLATRVSPKL